LRKKNTPPAGEDTQAALSAPAVADQPNPAQTTRAPTAVDEHMSILHRLLDPAANAAGQPPRRALEQLVRQRAVAFADDHLARGASFRQAAQRLGLPERTLRHWAQATPTGAAAPLLGRPPAQLDAIAQHALAAWLDQHGPGIGVPALRAQFDTLPRAALDRRLKDYRTDWRAANRRLLHVLHWQRPGTVWAMDFAEAPRPIDDRYRYLLAVRDLASGYQLLWQPVGAPTADVVLAELEWLFARHGAPWLLKTDNGSAFIADALRWVLHHAGVGQLFSPPHLPAYNGAIEASIGSLKTRTEQFSNNAGHAGVWTSADLAQAQRQANTQSRPRRLRGLTPAQAWQARAPLDAAAHARFQATVAQYRVEERLQHGWLDDEPLCRTEQAAIDRVAFRRALVAHDLLLFRRRRILPQIPKPKAATRG
jgi:putative transposase